MAHATVLLTILLHTVLHIFSCSACTFDSIQPDISSLPRVQVSFQQNSIKRYAENKDNNFSPIRIHVHYENQTSLMLKDFHQLQIIVQEAVLKIKSLLSVQPIAGRLLLKRKDACLEKLMTDLKEIRCITLKPNYAGEFCENKVDKFKIPDDHLLGQEIYADNTSSPLPSSIPNGKGVPDSDFILYVSAKQSKWCSRESVVSYASYCQLDTTDRPIAGFVNFCPSYFSEQKYTKPYLVQTAIHEIFHTLGFSSELFSKYKDCQDNNSAQRICYSRRNPARQDEEDGGYRIHLPTVAIKAENHFACAVDIGVPLEHSKYGASSHWDPLVMYGSIMAPSFKQFDRVQIDPITLALFSDTGWYHVNFTAADNYTWAKDSGCDFLHSPECNKYPFLCNMSLMNEHGCGFSPEGTAQCLIVSGIYPQCGVWQKNGKICGNNDTLLRNTPLYALNIVSSAEYSLEMENSTKVHIPVVFSHPEQLGSLQHDLQKLKLLVLTKLKSLVCLPKTWILKSSMVPSKHNGSYMLDLLIQRDSNSTEDEFEVILRRLNRFVPFKLDASEVVPVRTPANGDALFMKGWEAIVVLVGITLICLVLALLIASFIQIKGKIRHTIMSLPGRIR